MKFHPKLIVPALILTIGLAMLDDEAGSLFDLFRLENVPALILYTFAFYLLLLAGRLAWRQLRRSTW